MKTSRSLWFWLFIISIFVLYCLAWERPFCQTIDQLSMQQAIERLKSSGYTVTRERSDTATDRYATPDMFPKDSISAVKASARARTPDSLHTSFGWIPRDSLQSIPRPDTALPAPFGYDLFATQGDDPLDPYANVVPEEYRVGTGDQLLINLWGRVDLELELTVDRSGRIFIPKAGQVMVAGMTLAEAKAAAQTKLQSVYSNFQLSVTIGQMRTFRVFVFGEVRRPGAYTVKASASLIDALYRAGGPNERGTLRRVRLARGDSTTTVDLYDFLLSGLRGNDPRLDAGDVVFVDVAGSRALARGRVKRPGIYELKQPTTLREFIELAGGFDADAYRDRIMIDRLQAVDGRKLIDVNLMNDSASVGWATPVLDGDDISVFSKNEARPNVVWLEGWVKHPGAFERGDSMRVGDLIGMGEQLRPSAHLKRADLIRLTPAGGQQLIAVNLEAIIDGDGNADIQLVDGDRLTVYSVDQLQQRRYVWIDGEVGHSGRYELLEAMRLSDLVFRAGNPTRDALLQPVEIVRKNEHGETVTLKCNLDNILNRGDLAEDLLLRDGDYVFVRRDPSVEGHHLVTVEGEVRYPGRYSLLKDSETLYDVLQRAGGLTTRAFARGTIFIRSEISHETGSQNFGQILINAQPLQRDSTGHVYREELLNFNPDAMTRIVLDVPKILENKGGETDVVMRHGDRVIIPAQPSGIQVLGAVASPGTIRYTGGWRLKDYIGRAGGATHSSEIGETRLVKADGRVVECRRQNIRVELGDAVFVPPRVEKKTDWFKTVTQSVSLVGGVATTFLVFHSLGY